jgi:hypothetical protein
MPSRILANAITNRIIWVHEMLIRTTRNLTESQFSFQPQNEFTPSIAWHLWHIARWADRQQAGLSDRTAIVDHSGVMATERWARQNMIVEWGLDPSSLGVFEVGSEMNAESVPLLSRQGKTRIMDYALSAFSDFDAIIKDFSDEELYLSMKTATNVDFRPGVPGSLTVISPDEVCVIDDLLFHEGHASRHLGMIEVLRGLVLENGTATV